MQVISCAFDIENRRALVTTHDIGKWGQLIIVFITIDNQKWIWRVMGDVTAFTRVCTQRKQNDFSVSLFTR